MTSLSGRFQIELITDSKLRMRAGSAVSVRDGAFASIDPEIPPPSVQEAPWIPRAGKRGSPDTQKGMGMCSFSLLFGKIGLDIVERVTLQFTRD